jgi:ribose transport system permease protein
MTIPESKSTLVSDAQPLPDLSARPTRRSALTTVAGNYSSAILLLIFILVFSLTANQFFTLANFQNVLLQQTIVGCMALGVMFPLIVGEFDLSCGYMIGFIAMLGAFLGGKGAGTIEVIVAMVLAGLAVGFINGILVERFKISSFIATLATGIILQGITQGLSGGSVLTSGIPHFISRLGLGMFGWFGNSVWVLLAVVVILYYTLEHTPFGRRLYAVGGSERVAFLAGIRTRKLRTLSFVLSGLFVSLGAMFALGQNGSASPDYGFSLVLPAYAAVFLGVTTYRGGRYNVVGTIVGLLLVGFGFDGLTLWGVPFWVQPVFNGAVLLLAVLAARAENRTVS